MHPVASEETYSDGQLIFKEGSPGDWVYVILAGAVEISKESEGGKILIGVLKEGEIFGELGFLGGIKRTAAARAVGETTVGVIDRNFLDNEFNKLTAEFRSILNAVVLRFKKMIEDRISQFPIRTEPRSGIALNLAYKDRQSFVNACSGNISTKGLFVRTDTPMQVGENFVLTMQLPELKNPLEIQAQVVWKRDPSEQTEKAPAGMGIKFLDISAEDDRVLRKIFQDTLVNRP